MSIPQSASLLEFSDGLEFVVVLLDNTEFDDNNPDFILDFNTDLYFLI